MGVKKKNIKIDLNDIIHLENYRGYDSIWCYTPKLTAPELHIGYLNNEFFSFTSKPYETPNYELEKPELVINYYLDVLYLRCSSLEYNNVIMNEGYRPYLNALKSKKKMFEESVKVYNPAPNNQN